jgi:hypothetical protein
MQVHLHNSRSNLLRALKSLAITCAIASAASAETIWIEGENPTQSTMHRHPWWYDQVKREAFSGGDFISNFDKNPGEAEYQFTAAKAGAHEFWVRANPIGSSMGYKLGDGQWTPIDLSKGAIGSENVAADGKPDLRFIAWFRVGSLDLKQGKNTIRFRIDSKNSNHGYLDCFVLSDEHFQPHGILKPGQIVAAEKQIADDNRGWFVFRPRGELPERPAPANESDEVNLRFLNEKFAGDGGFIQAKGSRFVHSLTGEPVRFWAVNGPLGDLQDRASLDRCAKLLAKYGVNLVRIHGGYFDESGNVDPAKVKHALDVVQSMKAEGIYSHFSVYFPLWLSPKPDNKWLKGYDGSKHPFAALCFDPDFQAQYRNWLKALLLTPDAATGKSLVDEAAVFGIELINEDSYLFWTFATANIPDPELKILERQFGDWLKQKYGTLDKALAAWNGQRETRDDLAAGRIGFRGLWNIAHEKTARDKDTVRFLVESQRKFYQDTYKFLRGLGFKGQITASNWATADPQVLGPLEKYSYTVTDFIDRHGYFGCNMKGEAEWSIRDGYTYSDRSALRFEAEEPGKPRLFVHPAMDPSYDNKPSMISETTFNRPNRYRSEAPLFYASYGSLQGSDSIVHFALDGINWSVKPGYFMQPWTIATPAMMGQFPAAALVYRKGLVGEGRLMVDLNLKLDDILDLKGTPLPQDAALDELRLKDVTHGAGPRAGDVIDPLVHFVGRTNVNFRTESEPSQIADLRPYIDRQARTVTSSTRELKLNYGAGVLTINAPAAQGISGALREAGKTKLADLTISSDMPLGHIIAVSLDGQPLANSKRILLQVMSEEKPTNFRTAPFGEGVKRIVSIGQDPWLVKEFSGTVEFHRPDAARLQVEALDHSGFPAASAGHADAIKLVPATIYYLIHP